MERVFSMNPKYNKNNLRELVPEDLQRMRLPKKYHLCEYNLLGDKNKKIVKKYLSAYIKDSSLGLILDGKTGVGKTYIGCCIGKEMRRISKTVLFMPYYEINWQTLKEQFDSDTGSISDRIKNVDVLILDGYDSDSKKNESLSDLLRHRVNNYLPTILTTKEGAILFEEDGTCDDSIFNIISSSSFHIAINGDDKRDLERESLRDKWDDA